MCTGGVSLAALLQITRTVPIVFTVVPDPVGSGFVNSLSRPGGNVTGFVQFEYSLAGKWLELLKEIVPSTTRVAIIWDPAQTAAIGQYAVIQAMAPALGVEVFPINVRDLADAELGVAAFARRGGTGMIVTATALTVFHREQIVALAKQHKLPTVYPHTDFIASGGLVCMGPIFPSICDKPQAMSTASSRAKACRPAGAGADQVRAGNQPQDLQGAWPGSAPMLLARADKVVE